MRAQEDFDAKLVIIIGMGEKALIAAADLNELALLNPISGKEVVLVGMRQKQAFLNFRSSPASWRRLKNAWESVLW